MIYRNGVAYIERYAPAEQESLELVVPAARVDDLLKSLTVIDEASDKSLPVRYPTMVQGDGKVRMTIALPAEHGRLRITYVTESPAWKPSYRIMLDDSSAPDRAMLRAWAIVDNNSGEDWNNVRIGVGSTSALSFRYDLHSLRLIDRQRLGGGGMVAHAPPSGGQLRVLGRLQRSDVARLPGPAPKGAAMHSQAPTKQLVANIEAMVSAVQLDLRQARAERDVVTTLCLSDKVQQLEVAMTAAADGMQRLERMVAAGNHDAAKHETTVLAVLQKRAAAIRDESRQCVGREVGFIGESSVSMEIDPSIAGDAPARRPRETPPDPVSAAPAPPELDVGALLDELRQTKGRIRVEGFAVVGDDDPFARSQQRAEAVRDKLIADPLLADRVEAHGTGIIGDHLVRIVEIEGSAPPAEALDEPVSIVGDAHFVSPEPLTIQHRHSAMVSILEARTQAERVYLYDPVSPRGHKRFTFNALRIVNPSEHTLDAGPVTVYRRGQFLGEGLTEPILPKAVAFIPYALDRSIVVERQEQASERIDALSTIASGVAVAQARHVRHTKLSIVNSGDRPATVYIRHGVADGYTLASPSGGVQKLGRHHLVSVEVAPDEPVELTLVEHKPMETQIDLSSESGVGALGVYLSRVPSADGAGEGVLRDRLRAVVSHHKGAAVLEERIKASEDRMSVLRTRVAELNSQLVTLKKIPQAAKLRRHLAEKMQEISERLQRATASVNVLRDELMQARIALSDHIAELELPASGPQREPHGAGGRPTSTLQR